MAENRGTPPPAEPGVFSAADLRRRMSEIEAAKAAEELRRMQAQEEHQKAVMAEFHKPFDRTPEQLLPLVMNLVSHAAERGQSEVQVYRFPNSLCSDNGRRINNAEPDWEKTLEGRPEAHLRILERSPKTAWLWAQGRGDRLSGRDARRHRLFSDLEVADRNFDN